MNDLRRIDPGEDHGDRPGDLLSGDRRVDGRGHGVRIVRQVHSAAPHHEDLQQGLPRADSHVSKEGDPKNRNGLEKTTQVSWAHEKAKEQGRPVFMYTNPGHDPARMNTGGPFKLGYKPPTKGEYHEVKPDGSMVYHPAATKPIKAKGVHSVGSVAAARAIETTSDGKAPHAVRLWRAGWNETDKGPLNFTTDSAKSVMSRYNARGNPLVFDYEHESTLALDKRGGAPMRGVAAASSAALEVRDGPDGPELWAYDILWTLEAKRQIESGERRQISPISNYDVETKEITEIVNVALCREGATHHGTLLASATKGPKMDEIIQKIMEAIEGGDWEAAESLIQEAEGMDGGSDNSSVKMAKACAGKMSRSAAPPDSARPAAMARLAATRPRPVEGMESYARDLASANDRAMAAERRADTAMREAKTGRVEGIIAANRDCFDAVDERIHIRRADPEAAREHVASVKRKREGTQATTATVAASGGSGARPPKDGGGQDETHGLSPDELQECGRANIKPSEFKAAKDRNENSKRRAGARVN